MKGSKGITLIALVVTIIVLIILAGVSISLILGQDGIVKRATEGRDKYSNAAAYENEQLANVDAYAATIGQGGESTTPPAPKSELALLKEAKTFVTGTKKTVKDDGNHDVTIPVGFKIADDSATDRADGIVIEDANGNQFVWIPVDETTTYSYARTAFKGEDITSTFTETMPSDEQTSVSANKGYYIGRFEAADSTIPTAAGSALRASGASTTNQVAIKKGYAPYNYISRTNAIAKAEAMDSEQGYTATTKLCSSYAWDTAINFIQSKGGDLANYGTSSPQGNYKNVGKSYTDITGASQTVASGTNAGEIPTGQTTAVCNIYDMGGNVSEWTPETHSGNVYPCTLRGGNCSNGSANDPAGSRVDVVDIADNGIGFRVTLFL